MKDRITRTNVKKPSHRLFRLMIAVTSFTAIVSTAISIALFQVTSDNKVINQKIENYMVQVNYLEENNATNQARLNHTNNGD